MIAAGHQPNYLPWLGFFDKMAQCDVFIIEDNVQFERQGYQNRSRIKTVKGPMWLTVPVEHVGKSLPIDQIKIANHAEPNWAERQWLTLKHNYRSAPFWGRYGGFFEQTYTRKWSKLIDLNMHLIRGLMQFLEIEKPMVYASSLGISGKGSDLVLAQCKALGADVQLSGVGGRAYLNLQKFEEEGIKVLFQDFHYPVYPQLHGAFVPNLSAVDYLFCIGKGMWKENTHAMVGMKKVD